MADSGEKRMNLAALQRVDPYITSIVAMASQVALYKFNGKTNEWEKTETEGTLFVYGRCAKPFHGFIIMNRLNRNNLVEPLTVDMEFQRQDPFLLYKNSKTVIYGIWFYNKDDCYKIDEVMNRLMDAINNRKESSTSNNRSRRNSSTNVGQSSQRPPSDNKTVDIVSMLTKAQNEYNQSKGGGGEGNGRSGNNELKNMTTESTLVNLTELIRPKPMRMTNSSGPPPDLTCSSMNSRSPFNSEEGTSLTVAALFASVGGLQDESSMRKPQVPLSSTTTNDAERICGRQEWKSSTTGNETSYSKEQSLHAVLQQLISNPEKEKEEVKRGAALLQQHIQFESNRVGGQGDGNLRLQQMLNAPEHKFNHLTPSPTESGVTRMSITSPTSLPLPQSEISLMSPMMFSRLKCDAPPPPPPLPPAALVAPRIMPLTKEQLRQAFCYLLDNDQEFLTTLHEAYVKSLTAFTSGHIK